MDVLGKNTKENNDRKTVFEKQCTKGGLIANLRLVGI